MKKPAILAAAVVLASALAAPAMAQQVYSPGYQTSEPGTYYGQTYQDRAWRDSYNRWDGNDVFWPADTAAGVVGGVVGGAVGTAAAIATAPATMAAAPIGAEEYARRNGFVCMPGTWFRGEDGRRHLCQ